MADLKWIKHDGGPMPVPGDVEVAVRVKSRLEGFVPQAKAEFYRNCNNWWDGTGIEQIAEYAIVGQRCALDIQEGGDHYKSMAIQPVEYMMANEIPFMEGCVIKYVTRWRGKGGVEDLRKARHFLDLLIENEEASDGQA